MESTGSHPTRESDRVAISIPIRIFGSDVDGRAYREEARTLDVSRNGACIIVNRKLISQEEVVLHVKASRKESPAQIVGQIRTSPEGLVYGVRLLEAHVNLWDITFPPLSESRRALVRRLLGCTKCHLREVVYLDEYETEIYHAHRYVHHDCPRCRESTIWREAADETPAPKSIGSPSPAASPAPTGPPPAGERRRHRRIKGQFRACIRYKLDYAEEILEAANISRGGFCFATLKPLVLGTKFDVAIPYSPGMPNIFVPAEVVRMRPISDTNLLEIGATYLPV